MTEILGVDPKRPAPTPPRRVAVDYDAWHTAWVMWESEDLILRQHRASGHVDVPARARSMRRRTATETAAAPPTTLPAALEEGREILVKARVVTRPVASMLSVRDVRILLADLKRRIETRQAMGIAPGDSVDE